MRHHRLLFCAAYVLCFTPHRFINRDISIVSRHLKLAKSVADPPEHPTPLPCIAINRVFPRKVGLYAHLACGTKLAKHAVIGAPSSKAFVRRPLLPCPVPFMICGQPIFRESPPPLPLLLSLAKEWPISEGKLPTFFSRRRSQQQHLLHDGRQPGRGPSALWPWRPYWMICVFDSVVSS